MWWFLQQQLERWTRRGLRLFWYMIDLSAVVALSIIYFDGINEAAKFASQVLLLVCIVGGWQYAALEEIRK